MPRARECGRWLVMDGRLLDQLVEEIASRVAELVAGQFELPEVAEPWRLLTVEEAAERLGRSVRTVSKWMKSGSLPHVRLDSRPMFDLDDLRAFAAARRVSAAEARVLSGRFQPGRDAGVDAGLRAEDQPRTLRVRRRRG